MNKSRSPGRKPPLLRYRLLLYWSVLYVLVSIFVSARDVSFRVLTPLADTKDDNLVPYDYLVYGTERRFREGLANDVPAVKDALKDRGEAVVFKIPGQGDRILRSEYSVVFDERVPDLNIEVYVVKNITFRSVSAPFATVERLSEHYLPLVAHVAFSLLYFPTAFLCCLDVRKRRFPKSGVFH